MAKKKENAVRFVAVLSVAMSVLASFSIATKALAYGEVDPAFNAPPVPGQGNCAVEPLVLGDRSTIQSYLIPTSQQAWTFGLQRVRSDGSLDTGWGQQGRAEWAGDSSDGNMRAIVQNKDGSFLVVFPTKVMRVRPDGRFDTGYGNGGRSDPLSDTPYYFSAHSAVAMPDGGVAVMLYEETSPPLVFRSSNYAVARLDANGRSLGRTRLDFDWFRNRFYAWGVQADGRIQLASYPIAVDDTLAMHTVANGAFRPAVRRYSDDGSSSEAQGLLPLDVVASWTSRSVMVDPLGRVYFADSCTGGACGNSSLGIARFHGSGAIDGTFGQRGLATWSNGRGDSPGFYNQYLAQALWTGPDDQLTVVVRHTAGGGRAIIFDYDSRVIRMRADGTLVGSFPNDQSLGHADSRFAQLDDGQFLQAEFGAAGCARLVRKRGDHPKAPTILVEYEYRDRYFMTAEGPETALLDADPAPEKLRRTGRTFGGWLTAANPIGSLPACRFTGDAAAGPRGHFYSLWGTECDLVRADDQRLPAGARAWRFEGLAFSQAPVDANGACPANLQPVRRLFNDGFRRGVDPNHRYVTDPALVADMQSRGWILEGVAFCAPPSSP